MDRKIKKIISILLVVSFFGASLGNVAVAEDSDLILEVVNPCNITSAGNSCVANLKVTNNTKKELDGKAFLHIDYDGLCGSGYFDGEGISAEFNAKSSEWLGFSGWKNGTAEAFGFTIKKGETFPKLKISSVPNLCPGKYDFSLQLEGGGYVASSVRIGTTDDDNSSKTGEENPFDINKDGIVGIFEFTMLMAHWEETGPNISADFNKDGVVDILDFAILMANWSE
jgi:hypothetical protein